MIFNKYLSIFFSACLFMMLMFLTSMATITFFKGGAIPFIGLFFVVVYYFIARAFYSYLRNDDYYKNTKNHSSDMEGESYITKGESDTKKLFIVIWVLIILVLAAVSLMLYSINSGMLWIFWKILNWANTLYKIENIVIINLIIFLIMRL